MNPVSLQQTVQILEKTISPDTNELKLAHQYLEHELNTNPLEFMAALSDILSNPTNSTVARMTAALQLKNSLTGKNEINKYHIRQRWLSFSKEARNCIKTKVLRSLGTEATRPSLAAQCVARIAAIELPLGQWHEMIDTLCSNIMNDNLTEALQEASLQALGYVRQDVDHDYLQASLGSHTNNILTAVFHCMKKESTNQHIGLAAVNVLTNILDLTKTNFAKEMERNHIMEMVCETTQSKDTQIRAAALQCLVKIMYFYYEHTHAYMAQALFPITVEAIKSDIPEVALQGIEFWDIVCEEESTLIREMTEAMERGNPVRRVNYEYVKAAVSHLVPILVEKLIQKVIEIKDANHGTKGDEIGDDEKWTPCKAAGECLTAVILCCEQDILPYVGPFIEENIKNPDWRYRHASLMTFCSILHSNYLEPERFRQLVEIVLSTITELMWDPSVSVRNTAAHTIGQICDHYPEAAINPLYLKGLLQAIISGLKLEPKVAENVCWAFSKLVEVSQQNEDDYELETSCLSQYFDLLVDELLRVTNRPDSNQENLQLAAYEALIEMIRTSPRDCYVIVQKTTLVILERLSQLLAIMDEQAVSNGTCVEIEGMLGLLYTTLENALDKLSPSDASAISDSIMTAVLQTFVATSEVEEEALRVIGTLVEKLGDGFLKYMDAFLPFLLDYLQNNDDEEICSAAISVVADICGEITGTAILPYCDKIMTILLESLRGNQVPRLVKPQMLSVFGDIACAIKSAFEKYLDVVMAELARASQENGNPVYMLDTSGSVYESKECILNAYTMIIQSMCEKGPNSRVEAHLEFVLAFIKAMTCNKSMDDGIVRANVVLVGTLYRIFGGKIVLGLGMRTIRNILEQTSQSPFSVTRDCGQALRQDFEKIAKRGVKSSCEASDIANNNFVN